MHDTTSHHLVGLHDVIPRHDPRPRSGVIGAAPIAGNGARMTGPRNWRTLQLTSGGAVSHLIEKPWWTPQRPASTVDPAGGTD